MEYLGSDTYKIYLSNKDLILTKYEIEQIVDSYNCYQEKLSNNIDKTINLFRIEPKKRKYNNKEKIKLLFKKYHKHTNTKKETFSIIANKLNISIKAVEKAYYSK